MISQKGAVAFLSAAVCLLETSPAPAADASPPANAPKSAPILATPFAAPSPAPSWSPLPIEQNQALATPQSPDFRERLYAAESALGAGLADFAADLYTRLLRDAPELPRSSRERLFLGFADCLLAQNENAKAAEILATLPKNPAVEIRFALATIPLGLHLPETQAALQKLESAKVFPSDKPWLHVAKGLLALALAETKTAAPAAAVPPATPLAAPDVAGTTAKTPSAADREFLAAASEFDAAAALFSRANEPRKTAHARMLQTLATIRAGNFPANLSFANVLPERQAGSPDISEATGIRNAMLAAITLACKNRTAEAVEMLRVLRQSPLISREGRAGAALLTGYILRSGTPESADALCSVLEDAASPQPLQQLALQRLAASFATSSVEPDIAFAPNPAATSKTVIPPLPPAAAHSPTPRNVGAGLAPALPPPAPSPASTADANLPLRLPSQQIAMVYGRLTAAAAAMPSTAPILGEMHLVRAKLMFSNGNHALAERAANDLLENSQRTPAQEIDALRILAATALQGNAHRRAADQFARLAKLLPDSPARLQAILASADCLYKAATEGDASAFAAAAASYDSIKKRLPSPEERGNALFLQVLCSLEDGRFQTALRLLDTCSTDSAKQDCVDSESRLRAEWAAVEWLRKHRPEIAARRLAQILPNRLPSLDKSPTFRLRFLWQHARLSLATGDAKTAIAAADEISQIANSVKPPAAPPPSDASSTSPAATTEQPAPPPVSPVAPVAPDVAAVFAQRESILARAALLRQRAALLLSPESDAAPSRPKFADPEATAAAFLVEARLLSVASSHVRARKVFLEAWEFCAARKGALWADYAAEALFSAAREEMALAQKGAPGASFVQALKSLDNFTRQYPSNKYVPSARFLQADLFRASGNFEDAENVYIWLLARLPDGAARWSAEMGRADCLFARARAGEMAAQEVAPAPPAAAVVVETSPAPTISGSAASPAETAPAASSKANIAAKNLALAESAYARLYAIPGRPLDFKAEAGFKWANAIASRSAIAGNAAPSSAPAATPPPRRRSSAALDSAGNATAETDFAAEADRVRWEVASALLKTSSAQKSKALGANGRYWVARLLMEFAMSAKKRGDLVRAATAWRYLIDYNAGLEDASKRRLPLTAEAERELNAIVALGNAAAKSPPAPNPAPAPSPVAQPDGEVIDPPPAPKTNAPK